MNKKVNNQLALKDLSVYYECQDTKSKWEMEEVRLGAGGGEEDVWEERTGTVQVIDCLTRWHRSIGLPGKAAVGSG